MSFFWLILFELNLQKKFLSLSEMKYQYDEIYFHTWEFKINNRRFALHFSLEIQIHEDF